MKKNSKKTKNSITITPFTPLYYKKEITAILFQDYGYFLERDHKFYAVLFFCLCVRTPTYFRMKYLAMLDMK